MAVRRELVQWTLEVDESGAVQGLESAAERARRLATEAARVDKGLDSLGRGGQKVASMLGGPFANLADIVFDLGESASGASGAIGTMGSMALGAVVGVAALAYAGVSLASSAEEAAKRLEEQGLAAMMPASSRESVDRYRDATTGLRNEVDALTVALGGPAMDAVSNIALILAGAADKAGMLASKLQSVAGAMPERPEWAKWLGEAAMVIGSGGWAAPAVLASEVAEAILETGEAAIESQEAIKKSAASELAVTQMLAEAEAEEARRKKAAEDATRKLAQARTEAARAAEREAAATDKMWQSLDSLGAKLRSIEWDAPKVDLSGAASAAGGMFDLSGIASLSGMSEDAAASIATQNQQTARAISTVTGVAAGGVDSASALLAAAGPVGAAIGAAINLAPIVEGLSGVSDSILTTVRDLPETISALLTDAIPGILEALPDILLSAVQAVIESLPQILATTLEWAISTVLFGGPFVMAIARGVYEGAAELIDAIRAIPQAFLDAVTGAFGGLKGDNEKLVDLRGAKGERNLFSVSFDSGSREITRTGLAMLHKGEEVSRRAYRGRSGSAAGATINVYGPDTREIVRQVSALLGGSYGSSYGTGDTL